VITMIQRSAAGQMLGGRSAVKPGDQFFGDRVVRARYLDIADIASWPSQLGSFTGGLAQRQSACRISRFDIHSDLKRTILCDGGF
jgi:hypothetical protein